MNVSVKGADLFYSTRGSGPACLVLSGIGTKPYERLTPPQLSDRLRLVYVDLRGSGQSTGEPTELTFDVLADDLEAIRIDLGVERIAVLGHSILGVLAIEYGRRRPASVSHVIAAGTPPSGDMARELNGFKVEEWTFPGGKAQVELLLSTPNTAEELSSFERLVSRLLERGVKPSDRSKTEAGSECSEVDRPHGEPNAYWQFRNLT